jgi:23S rRNA (adenine2030-N6)-methyltransferase
MFVFNPPWKLDAGLKSVLPVLARLLAQDDTAGWTLRSHAS